MKIHAVGDSITYLVSRYGGATMFLEDHAISAVLDGDPGDRADTPSRGAAWIAACATEVDRVVYALGCNDVMKQTFRDPNRQDDPEAIRWSDTEQAILVGVLHDRLSYAASLGVRPIWVNITTRTMSGHYNAGARRVNAAMLEACTANGWGYVDWDVLRAPTTDLIHPKPAGAKMWVDAVAAEALAGDP